MLFLDPVQKKNIESWHSVCEILWVHQLLTEVGLKASIPTKLWLDNQGA